MAPVDRRVSSSRLYGNKCPFPQLEHAANFSKRVALGGKDPPAGPSAAGCWPILDAFPGVNYQKVTMETHS